MNIIRAVRLASKKHVGITRASHGYDSGHIVIYPMKLPECCVGLSWDAATSMPRVGSRWNPDVDDFLDKSWRLMDYPCFPGQILTKEIKEQYDQALLDPIATRDAQRLKAIANADALRDKMREQEEQWHN